MSITRLQTLVYNSAALGCFDPNGIRLIENYGVIRLYCRISAIPAGGTDVDGRKVQKYILHKSFYER